MRKIPSSKFTQTPNTATPSPKPTPPVAVKITEKLYIRNNKIIKKKQQKEN